MTCKDCIYFKRCTVLGVELDMHHNKEAEKNCRHFKNKADFAEVVRCKYCKHFKKENNGYCSFGAGLTVADGNGYCNYGERAERE